MTVFYNILSKPKGSTVVISLDIERNYVFGQPLRPVALNGYVVKFILNAKIISYNGNLQKTTVYSSTDPQSIIRVKDGNILIGLDTGPLPFDLYDCSILISSQHINLPLIEFQLGFDSTLGSTTQATIVNNMSVLLSNEDFQILNTNSNLN